MHNQNLDTSSHCSSEVLKEHLSRSNGRKKITSNLELGTAMNRI